ncbi:MAG: DoxX family protein [Acidimicrobiales bacterium]
MASGQLLLRVTVGSLMTGHGLQKLTGSFGGSGLEGTERMMESIGLHPPKRHAIAAALGETIGGALTATGFLNPLGPAMITGVMAVAIQKVHRKNGVWVTTGGYEYNLILTAAALALAAGGPGALSVDGLRGKQRSGMRWAIAAATLGLGAAAATLALAERKELSEVVAPERSANEPTVTHDAADSPEPEPHRGQEDD